MAPKLRRSAAATGFSQIARLLALGHLLAFVDRAKIAGAMPAIRHQIAMSDATAGWVIGTAFALGYGATILAMTAAARAAPVRWSWQLPGGLGLWAGASLMTGLSPSVTVLLISRILVGCGQALFIPAALSLVVMAGDRVGSRSAGMATFTAAASLGRSVGLLLLAAALVGVGWVGIGPANVWRGAFVVTALPNAALLLVIVLRRSSLLPIDAAPIDTADAASPPGRRRWAYLLLAVAPIILIQAIQGWAPTLFVTDRGAVPSAAAAWLGVLTLVGGAGGQTVGGWLFQRGAALHGRVPVVVVAGLSATLPALGLLGWAGGSVTAGLGLLAAYLALSVASFAALFGWQQILSDAGRVMGNGIFMAVITVIGVGAGPLVTGILADLGTTLRWSLVITAAGCVAIAAVAALLVGREQRDRAAA